MKHFTILLFAIAFALHGNAVSFPVKPPSDTTRKSMAIMDEPFGMSLPGVVRPWIYNPKIDGLAVVQTLPARIGASNFASFKPSLFEWRFRALLSAQFKLFADSVQITLPDSLHVFVLAFLKDKNRVDVTNYQNFLAANIAHYKDSEGKNHLSNPGHLLTYTAPVSLLLHAYDVIGDNKEGVVAHPNALVQDLLVQQLAPTRPDVLLLIGEISQRKKEILNANIQADGIDRIAEIKLQ